MIALALLAAALTTGDAPSPPQRHGEHMQHQAPAADATPPEHHPPQPTDAPDSSAHAHHAGAMDAPSPADPACPPEHAAMGHCTPKPAGTMPNAAGPHPASPFPPAVTPPSPGSVQPTYADRIWGHDAMAAARATMRREHGGMAFSQVMLDLAEVQLRGGRDRYRWDGAFWYGGDINRLTLKTEGDGAFGGSTDAEVQALYSRAIGPYFNLQAGVRQDIATGPDRTYATVGVEGLAPYWFDVEGALFLSNKGELLARIEGYYDQRITQRLVLQPRAEINLSAQRVPVRQLGSGVTDAELGLRLRYEIAREFAPYVGMSWERQLGGTARYARSVGDDAGGFGVVAGIRVWF
ncbi:copper resistance protein B [Sphingomonas dokdonensis]|uniref:Copper resistance protein B n=1 Tax=Sphingomonas dokdonensis TaxID=344880 RepID=A0A245ZNF1_9SPHN|nr:copper resistance protein B [Sphingomonas dokdonensis]OWK31274.1 copper resistance protein B precursor [Sphingomonas dokdonensis]